MLNFRKPLRLTALLLGAVALASLVTPASAAQKPNIVVIWGDDIGISNVSAYSEG
jgi:hypothetical protein